MIRTPEMDMVDDLQIPSVINDEAYQQYRLARNKYDSDVKRATITAFMHQWFHFTVALSQKYAYFRDLASLQLNPDAKASKDRRLRV